MRRTFLLTVVLSLVAAWPAGAQNLTVEFHDGRVSVDATAVPVRTILTEWGKVGGTKIVGVERISGAPITVKLINVTEAQALETILRSVAGYMAAPRNAGVGASRYDRIMVMATSSTPPPQPAANGRPAQQPSTAFSGTQRFVPPRQRPEQAEPVEQDEPDENPPNPPVFTFPQQGQNGFVTQPGQFQTVQPNGGVVLTPGAMPTTTQPAAAPAQPQAPIGVSQPGMMVQPPPPATSTPGTVRPPGRGGNQ